MLALAGGPAGAASASTSRAAQPVPSLTPKATAALWKRLVERPRRRAAAPADCRPSRLVFYAATDWLRLATKLAATPSPCADAFVSIPPSADKTEPRADQAWRIRALGPGFHALAEINVTAWASWVASTGNGWFAAGVEARRRMAAAGFDVSLGDSWVVNEVSSAVRRGDGTAREDMRDLVRGLYSPAPSTRGAVFVIGSSQATTELSVYQARLQDWYQDTGFWTDMGAYVADWSQEAYGDVRAYAVPGSSLAARRDALAAYLRHPLTLADAAPPSGSAAATFLNGAYGPIANAAWRYDTAFGWTDVPIPLMQDFASAQVYAIRSGGDRGGFAWKPRNSTGLSAADFAAQTDALADRLAMALRDAATSVDPADPGVGACGPAGRNDWCAAELPGAVFNAGWLTFAAWRPPMLAFAAVPAGVSAGAPSAPFTVELRTATGVSLPATRPVTVTVASSSASGAFSNGPAGPWTATLELAIPAGVATTSFSYLDPTAGAAVLTASTPGASTGSQAIVVAAAPAVPVPLPPVAVSVAVSPGTGTGRVVGSGGIDCGPAAGCQESFPRAADASPVAVGLEARPGPGSVFAGWTGACLGQGAACSLSLVQDASTTAAFTTLIYPSSARLLGADARREIATEGAADGRSAAFGCLLAGPAHWGMRPAAGAGGAMTAVRGPGPSSPLARFVTGVLGGRTRACADDSASALLAAVVDGAPEPDARRSTMALLGPPVGARGRGPACWRAKAVRCARARAAASRYAAAGARRAVAAQALAATAHRYAAAVGARDPAAATLQLAVGRAYLNEWVSAADARAATGVVLRRSLARLGARRATVPAAVERQAGRALLGPSKQLRTIVAGYARAGAGGRAALLHSLERLARRPATATTTDALARLARPPEGTAIAAAAAALSIADLGIVLERLERERPPSAALGSVIGVAWEAVSACDAGSARSVARLLDLAGASATSERTFVGPRLALLRAAGTPLVRAGAAIRCR